MADVAAFGISAPFPADPANGITTDWMTYKVVQITIDGDIAFAVIYGG